MFHDAESGYQAPCGKGTRSRSEVPNSAGSYKHNRNPAGERTGRQAFRPKTRDGRSEEGYVRSSNSCARCAPTCRKMAVLLPLSVSASESGSQSRSLSVFVARHDLSGSITIADCGCDADSDTDPDGPWSWFYFRNRPPAPGTVMRRLTWRAAPGWYEAGLQPLDPLYAL